MGPTLFYFQGLAFKFFLLSTKSDSKLRRLDPPQHLIPGFGSSHSPLALPSSASIEEVNVRFSSRARYIC